MSPWALLGIAPTADAAAIRRAYARKLKLTRPDEDPEGFQRLVQARDAALKEATMMADGSWEEDTEPEDEDEPALAAADPIDGASAYAPPFTMEPAEPDARPIIIREMGGPDTPVAFSPPAAPDSGGLLQANRARHKLRVTAITNDRIFAPSGQNYAKQRDLTKT